MEINNLMLSSLSQAIKNQYRSAVPISVLVLLSLLVTVVMIVLNIYVEPSESGIDTAKIITSFIAGMFGYATLYFLRRSYFK